MPRPCGQVMVMVKVTMMIVTIEIMAMMTTLTLKVVMVKFMVVIVMMVVMKVTMMMRVAHIYGTVTAASYSEHSSYMDSFNSQAHRGDTAPRLCRWEAEAQTSEVSS